VGRIADRTFAFDEFGPLGIGPTAGCSWAEQGRPGRLPATYVILDNLSAHNGKKILRWAKKNNVHLCFTPTNASWANPIEARFGPLRQFTLANSNYPNHTVQTRALHAYLALAQRERPPSRRPGRPTQGTRASAAKGPSLERKDIHQSA
jgi:hypothetical protein